MRSARSRVASVPSTACAGGPTAAGAGGWSAAQGLVAGLQREGMPVAGRHVFQAGCGGAGKAVAHALAAAGVASLHLVDAKPELAQALIASLRQHHPQLAVHTGDAPGAGHDLLVNATPCGMAPGDPMPFDLRDAASGAVVAELFMKPERTRLLDAASARGHRIHLGRHLLESQAALVARYFGLCDLTHSFISFHSLL